MKLSRSIKISLSVIISICIALIILGSLSVLRDQMNRLLR